VHGSKARRIKMVFHIYCQPEEEDFRLKTTSTPHTNVFILYLLSVRGGGFQAKNSQHTATEAHSSRISFILVA
jgi:hypothetical protein